MTDSILIIDDDVEIGRIFAKVAKMAGYQSYATVDPQDFIERVRSAPPSHVLLDLQMPKADGVELLRFLAEEAPFPRIIIASGVDTRVLDIARQIGLDRGLDIAAVLSKPIRTKQLREVLTGLHRDVDTDAATLRQAMQDRQFFLAYQPKLELSSNRIISMEALVRWQHPEKGVVAPGLFVPAMERLGLADELADLVIRDACAAIARCDRLGQPEMTIAVNISAATLWRTDLASELKALCREAGVPSKRLIFEVTESMAMTDPAAAMENLASLRLADFALALDDFGTGMSSLAHLRRMPFNELKIDRLFVKDLKNSQDDRAIIAAIVAIGRALGMRTVAEGCEDADTLQLLREIGCDIVQGYHIARPMALDDAIELATAGEWGSQ